MFIKSNRCGNSCCGFSFKKSTQVFAVVDLLISMLIAISLLVVLMAWTKIEEKYLGKINMQNSSNNSSIVADTKTYEGTMEVLKIIRTIVIAVCASTMAQFILAIVLIFSAILGSKKGCILWMVLTFPLLPLSLFIFKIVEICIICSFIHELDQDSKRETSPDTKNKKRRQSLNSIIALEPHKGSPAPEPRLPSASAIFILPSSNPTTIINQPLQPSSPVIISSPVYHLPKLSYQHPSDHTHPIVLHENNQTTILSTVTNVNCSNLSISSSSSSDNNRKIGDLEDFNIDGSINSGRSLNEYIKSIETTESIGIELESIKSDDEIGIGSYENDLGALTYEYPCENEENEILTNIKSNEYVEDEVDSVKYDDSTDNMDVHSVDSILNNDS